MRSSRCPELLSQLSDGRQLAYAEWGDPGGFPCLFFHGSPGSRLFARYLDDAARRAGLRLIAPDRPGFGASDPVDAYTILGVADDSLALARSLALDRFAVIGVSGGAPYVYAASILAPELIPMGAIISGLAPGSDDEASGVNAKLVKAIRTDSRFIDARLRLQWSILGRAVRLVRSLPLGIQERCIAAYSRSLPEPDREVLARKGLAEMSIADIAESMRQGSRGVFQELVAFMREPWGFDLSDVLIPMHLWHGTADENAPCSAARRAAEELARCEATYYEGEAHMTFMNHADEILTTIAQVCRIEGEHASSADS